jgi:large subunit ribosomal protein L10
MANSQKKEIVKKIGESIVDNKNFLLIKYQAVNTQTFNDLKNKLKKVNASVTVIKNTLFEKAVNIFSAKEKKLKDIKTKFFPLKEPTAIVSLGENWSLSLKALSDFIKNVKNISFKLGILDDELYDQNQLLKISKLPGKDQLALKIISSLQSPARKFVYSLSFNMNKFVYLLKQKSKKEGR